MAPGFEREAEIPRGEGEGFLAEVISHLGDQVDRVMAAKGKTYTAELGKTLRRSLSICQPWCL